MRSNVFWFLDRLKGEKVKKRYNAIKNNKINIDYNTQAKELNSILEYAIKNVKYYKNIKKCNINNFPIVDKVSILEKYNEFISDEYKEKKVHKMFTSGSTGTPFTVLQNKSKRLSVLSELIFYGEDCGFRFGDKQTYFRVWTEKLKKTKFQAFKQNLVMIDISDLSDKRLKEIAIELKQKKIKSILSFASTLDVLANYLEKEGFSSKDFYVTSIISSSEILQDETRKKLEKIFKCNVVSRYSNQENGVLGQECINEKEFHLNETNYYFEFLEFESDKHVKEGEVGRIVITDLTNKAMPLIRYDTGDTGIYSTVSKCGRPGKVITEIYGRRMDIIYNTKGEKISPFVLSSNILLIDNLKQFKFIQVDLKDYKMILNTNNKPMNLEYVKQILHKELGEDSNIEVEYVNEIPVLSSGKRKYIENKIGDRYENIGSNK